ncbi:MAG TPA: dihydrofolate reductase family protein [Candidatus Udaeobacter sp.]|nr:dihydrofolate reductase family protein [Candidatus Udaeobacter sp.]
MRKLAVFNHVTMDGYFTDSKGDMSFAHRQESDPEWEAFIASNTSDSGTLVFGRITYEMMASFWPTPMAAQQMPDVAARMNNFPKVVFSRTLDRAIWQNTQLLKGDLLGEIRRLKQGDGPGLTILGSGSIVAQLAPHGVIDQYQMVVNPVILGSGRTMFEGVKDKLPLELTETRRFRNGNVLLSYEPSARDR